MSPSSKVCRGEDLEHEELPVYNIIGLIQQGAGHRHTGASRTAYQPPFLAQIQCHTRSPLAAPTSRTGDKEGTSLANMIREDLVAEHIVIATYREIVTNFA